MLLIFCSLTFCSINSDCILASNFLPSFDLLLFTSHCNGSSSTARVSACSAPPQGVSVVEGLRRRNRQVIGNNGGMESASVSDWPTLCDEDCASVGEGTTMLKAPTLLHTDDAIEVNISDIFAVPGVLADVHNIMSTLSCLRTVLEVPEDRLVQECIIDERCVLHFDAEVSNTQEVLEGLQTFGKRSCWNRWQRSSNGQTEQPQSRNRSEMWKALAATSQVVKGFPTRR